MDYCSGSVTYLGQRYLGSAQDGQVASTAKNDATSGEWAMATFDAVISASNAILRRAPTGPSGVKARVLANAGGTSRAMDLPGATGQGAASRLSFTGGGQLASAAVPIDQFAGGLRAVRVWPSSPPANASGPACAPASPAG